VDFRFPGVEVLIAYRLNRSFAWNAAHPPKLPARPRKMPPAPARLFDRVVECPVGIAAGPLPNSKWIEAYARLGYGLLTYKTVRTVERAAFPAPNLVFCGLGDPAVVEPTPRRLDPAAVTWAASFGLPSAKPEVWRADVAKTRARLAKSQLLVVSVIGTPAPGGDGEQLARDYAQAARWARGSGRRRGSKRISPVPPSPRSGRRWCSRTRRSPPTWSRWCAEPWAPGRWSPSSERCGAPAPSTTSPPPSRDGWTASLSSTTCSAAS
jgi:hypothetical protein